MKRIILIALAILMILLCSCGKSQEAEKADELILAIGEVTLESSEVIEKARIYYDTLDDSSKESVENYDVLTAAEDELARLDAEREAEEEAARIAEEERIAEEMAALEEVHWEQAFYVDDFNDPTDEWYLRGSFEGTFSNTATSGSTLEVYAFFDEHLDSASYDSFSIRLVEYGSLIANFNVQDEDDIIFKIKVGDDVYTENVDYIVNNDLYIERGNPLFTAMINALEKGEEISCVVEVYYNYSLLSTYRFTMDANGLADIPHSWKAKV